MMLCPECPGCCSCQSAAVEEIHEPSHRLSGCFLLKAVAAGYRTTADVGCVTASNGKDIAVNFAGAAFGSPHHQGRHWYFFAGFEIRRVHIEIAGDAGAVVGAGAANGIFVEAEHIFGKGSWVHEIESDTGFGEFVRHIPLRGHRIHHASGKTLRSYHEHPVPGSLGPLAVYVVTDMVAGQDVDKRRPSLTAAG